MSHKSGEQKGIAMSKSNNKKKKKLTPRELEKKQEKREQAVKQKRKARIYSMIAVTIGCVGSSFLWPRENTATYIALCVATGVIWGIAFDLVYAKYVKNKMKKGK